MRTRFLSLTFLALLAACSSAESGGSDSSGSANASADAVEVTVADFMIDPADIEVAGPTVAFTATNDGPTPHNFTIRDEAGEIVVGTSDLSTGESETITAELEPGEYTIFCSLAGHESLGMSGTLTVGGGS
jgi:plastocyanin